MIDMGNRFEFMGLLTETNIIDFKVTENAIWMELYNQEILKKGVAVKTQ